VCSYVRLFYSAALYVRVIGDCGVCFVRVGEFPIFAWRSGCCSVLIVLLIVCDIPYGNRCWGDTLLWKSFSGWILGPVGSTIHNEVAALALT
jgi:hypothetical protein